MSDSGLHPTRRRAIAAVQCITITGRASRCPQPQTMRGTGTGLSLHGLARPTALFLLSSLLARSDARVVHQLPGQTPHATTATTTATTTVPYQVLKVVSWPLQPTPPPPDPFALGRRQANTICGYIGGDLALPATCGAGSHCVLDTEHNVVGCCPDGADVCTAGVFTGCVDANSGPQTEVNPYVYSCTGAAVCYKNVFDGGFSQFGCGTASDQATTVLASASGMTASLSRPTVSVSFTQSVITLSEPTTLGTVTSSSSSSSSSKTSSSTSSSTSTSTSSSSSSSSTDTTSTTGAEATTPADAASDSSSTNENYRTGAIVGGTIGGLAVLIALVALAFFFVRRRNANVRQGPGPGGARGTLVSAPKPGGGTGFAALATHDGDGFDAGPTPAASSDGLVRSPDHDATQQQQQQQQQQQHQNYYDHHHQHADSNPEMTTVAAASSGALPPLATAVSSSANTSTSATLTNPPPMPFQSEVSPVADDPDNDRSLLSYGGPGAGGAAGGGDSAGVSSLGVTSSASVSSLYPPSSIEGYAQSQQLQPPPPAASPAHSSSSSSSSAGVGMGTGTTGLAMGLSSVLAMGRSGSSRAKRQLESDQVPLTREIDDFSQGFHAALGRIGEEDEEDDHRHQNQHHLQPYRDHEVSSAGGGAAQQQQQQHQQQHEYHNYQQQQHPYYGRWARDSAGGSGRPLWQQNRRQSRNLMWM